MECPRPVSPQERGVDMAANDDMDQQSCPLSRRNIDSVRFRQHQACWRSGLRLLMIELLACRLPRLLCLSPTLLPFPENVSRTYARCLLPGLLYKY
jgi:hypothetical protein